jgi:hypothetical protein
VSVKAFVDRAQVGSTKYVSLEQGVSDTMTFCGFHMLRKIILSRVRL